MTLDLVRVGLALMLWATIPAGVAYWLVIHSFVGYWRRVGVVQSYLVVVPLCLMICGGFLRWGIDLVQRTDLGADMRLFAAGAVLWGLSVFLDRRTRRILDFRTMIGVVELGGQAGVPDGGESGKDLRPPTLLTDDLYSRVRHPRYLALMIAAIGWALMANHLASYLMTGALLLAVLLITEVEDRELVERFGDDYRSYRRQVPRLFPFLRP